MRTATRPRTPRLVVFEHGAAIHRVDGLIRMIPRPLASSDGMIAAGQPPITFDIDTPPPDNGPPAA